MSEWVNVKDRLPKCSGMKDPNKSWWIYDGRIVTETRQHPSWWNKPGESNDIVTHWKNKECKPEPPK